MVDGSDRRGRWWTGRRSTFGFCRYFTLYKDALPFRGRGSVNLRGIDLLGNVGRIILIISIPFMFIVDIDLTILVLFLVVLVMDGDAIWN